jgi:energy-coupling factor transport system substrate-specific component
MSGVSAGRHVVVPVRLRSAVALGFTFAVGIVAFGWPFLTEPGAALDTSHSGDAPLVFVVLLPLLAAVVLAELASGGVDAKAVAMLGMLAAVGGALRALGPGTAGLEPSFAVILLGGRVFGRGFGFVLGAVTLFTGALLTGGVGPWLPFQMIAAGWVGFFAGCLPPARGRTEVLWLTAYSFVVGLLYGALMNLWFWPFGSFGPEVSFVAGAPFADNAHRYAVFYVATSLPWDLGRAVLTSLVVLLAGSALLRALRRASRRAAFDAEPRFTGAP